VDRSFSRAFIQRIPFGNLTLNGLPLDSESVVASQVYKLVNNDSGHTRVRTSPFNATGSCLS